MREHVQCRLRRVDGATQVSWLPKERAVVGGYVKLKDNGTWTNGWEVVETGTTRPSEYIFAQSRNHKTHRRATDI